MPTLSVDAATIRDRFNYDWAEADDNGADQNTWWWYAISIRVDPNEVIADDGDGHLWSVPFITDGENNVTFGTPAEVRQTFVPVAVGEGAAATAMVQRRRQSTLAAALDRPTKGDHGDRPVPSQYTPVAPAASIHEEDQTMTIDLAALRTRLELDENATEEQINEALAAEQPATFTAEEVAQREQTARDEATAASASAANPNGVTIDKAALAQLQADATAGRKARDEQESAGRASFLDGIVGKGKIPPVARAGYASQLAQGGEVEKHTRAFLDSLPDNTIPVELRGSAADIDADDAASASVTYTDDDGFVADGVSLLTPAERARQRANA